MASKRPLHIPSLPILVPWTPPEVKPLKSLRHTGAIEEAAMLGYRVQLNPHADYTSMMLPKND